jgi:hypothetical protein
MLYSSVIALAVTGSVFANENAEINPRFEKFTDKIVCIRLTNAISEKQSSLAVEMQYYDFVCAGGATAHAAFSSYQAAFDWGMKWCAEQNRK